MGESLRQVHTQPRINIQNIERTQKPFTRHQIAPINKWVNEIKDKIQMATNTNTNTKYKNVQKCPIPLAIKEMQIKLHSDSILPLSE